MLKKGKGGKIINISSIFGVVSREKRSMYSASKSALLGLTRASALDLSKHNVLVNSVSPGFVNTSLTRKILGKKGMKNIIKEIPIKRMATTKDISNLIIFLCSNYNSYITGQNFIIDGGVTCK
jgi:3-oxoacyl-[acyl-carrier protein] reductase